MKVRLGLVAGIVACLLPGLGATMAGDSDTPEPVLSITVPAGRVGDHVEYTTRWDPGATQGREARTVFEVRGPGTALDRFGETRPVVQRTSTWETSGAPLGVLRHARGIVGSSFIDLETREVVRVDESNQSSSSTGPTSTLSPARPGYAENTSFFPFRDEEALGAEEFWFQARTFQLGATVEDPWTAAAQCANVGRAPALWIHSARSSVASQGRIDGTAVLGIRSERDYEGQSAAGPRVRISLHQTTWISAESPYPLRMDVEESRDDGTKVVTERRTVFLSAFRPGVTPIGWPGPPQTSCAQDEGPQRERGISRYGALVDGADSRLGFRLGEALASVSTDLSLVQFTAWRAQHPKAELVFAYYSDTRTGTASDGRPSQYSWRLVFAEERAGFGLFSRSAGRGGPVTNDESSPYSGAYERSSPPRPWKVGEGGPITVAELERLWATVFPAPRPTFNFLSWSRDSGASGTHVSMVVSPYYAPLGFPTAGQSFLPGSDDQHRLVVNITEGSLVTYSGISVSHPVEFASGQWGGDVPIEPLATSTAGPPTLSLATAASGSLLALFLVLYFLPILKYFAGQLAPLLPGYAKLRRDDVLGHRLREEAHGLIRREPGITPPQIQRVLGTAWSTLVYHLSVLEKNKLVSSLVDGRHKRFFPVGSFDWDSREKIAALRNHRTRMLYEAIQATPGLNIEALAERAKVTSQATAWHLKRLVAAGLIRREKQGRNVCVYAKPFASPMQPEAPAIAA